MSGFKAAYINEMIKMRKKSKIVSAAVVSLIAVIIWQLALSVISGGMGVSFSGAASFALSVLGIYSSTLLPLFAVFVVIDSFNGEYAANTMKQTLLRLLSRLMIFASKVAAVASFVGASLVFMLLLSIVIGVIGDPGSLTIAALGHVVLAFILSWLPMMVFILLVILLAQFSKNGILTFFLAVFTYLLLIALRFFYPQLANMLILPLFDWHIGWLAGIRNVAVILRQGLLLISQALIFLGLGCRMFETREL